MNRRDKAISALGNCLNEPWLPCVVIQNFAQVKHVGAKHLRLHVGFRPEGVQQFVMRDQAAGMVNEVAQHRERFRRQIDLGTLVPEAFIRQIQCKRFELLHADQRSSKKPTPILISNRTSMTSWGVLRQ